VLPSWSHGAGGAVMLLPPGAGAVIMNYSMAPDPDPYFVQELEPEAKKYCICGSTALIYK